MTDWALELAENPNTYVPLRPGHDRVVTDRYVIWLGSGDHPVAQRFRFRADELDEVRAEIHEHVRSRGRTACSWEVGSSATPADLVVRLEALGLERDDEFLRVGMALTEPPAGAAEVEVRRAETDEDRRVAAQIAAAVFGTPYSEPPPPDPNTVVYLAFVDGRPIARATGSFSEHGVTLFGAYRLPPRMPAACRGRSSRGSASVSSARSAA